jgi:hypothetical protein
MRAEISKTPTRRPSSAAADDVRNGTQSRAAQALDLSAGAHIVADDGQQAAMQDAELLANHPPDNEQRLRQYGQIPAGFRQWWHAGRSRWQWPSIEQLAMGQQRPKLLAA